MVRKRGEIEVGPVTDKRVIARRRTKNLIYDAMFELLGQKPYSAITITELIETSGVARTTFYRHFSSVYDVMIGYFTCMDERFIDSIGDTPIDFASPEYLTRVFTFYGSIGKQLLAIRDAGLTSRFVNNVIQFHLDNLGDMPANSPERYALYYYAAAIYYTAEEWITSGMRETPEELAKVFLEIPRSQQNNE